MRLHAVVGGHGRPLLLIHGWPGNWYYWRLIMPALARNFEVIAVDQRGIGLSDKPETGYDTRTLANDMIGLMNALGHPQFAVVGVDTGMLIGYALAADHPRPRATRRPRRSPPTRHHPTQPTDPARPTRRPPCRPPLAHPVQPTQRSQRKLVQGRENIFYTAEFQASAGTHKLPDQVVKYYVDGLAASPEALHGSFQLYRAFGPTTAQNKERMTHRLQMPVLAMGGAESLGAGAAGTLKSTADNVQTLVIPDTGHWLAEQAANQLTTAFDTFLTPYRT